jgi:hypothetical protein
MLQSIFKYPLGRPSPDRKLILLPIGAKVLSAGIQQDRNYQNIYIWCLVNPMKLMETENRVFCVVGTGWDIVASSVEYIGRVTEGVFEWHVMEVHSE